MLKQIQHLAWAYVDLQGIPEDTANWFTIAGHVIYRRRENVIVKDITGRAMLAFQRTGEVTKTANYRPLEAAEVLLGLREEMPLDALADL